MGRAGSGQLLACGRALHPRVPRAGKRTGRPGRRNCSVRSGWSDAAGRCVGPAVAPGADLDGRPLRARVRRDPGAGRRGADQPRQRQSDRSVVHRTESALVEQARAQRLQGDAQVPVARRILHASPERRVQHQHRRCGSVLPLRVPARALGLRRSPRRSGCHRRSTRRSPAPTR